MIRMGHLTHLLYSFINRARQRQCRQRLVQVAQHRRLQEASSDWIVRRVGICGCCGSCRGTIGHLHHQ